MDQMDPTASTRSLRPDGLTPWVIRLLAINLLVFVLQMTVLFHPSFLNVTGFDPVNGFARPWTFVTYMFVHGGVLHLAFNMLALYFFGPPVEARMGGRLFIGYYLVCGVGGALLSYLLVLIVPVHLVIGASGAILGVAVAFAWYWPDQPVFVFPFPEPIAAKWFVTFVVAISLGLAWLGAGTGGDGVAHLAHLGGIGTGLLMLKLGDLQLARHERRLRRAASSGSAVAGALARPATLVARHSDAGRKPAARTTSPTSDRVQAEIDRVLDKISARGVASLTPAERKFLAEMSRRMRDRH
jgi:membrane associated rhomboid family serine protease